MGNFTNPFVDDLPAEGMLHCLVLRSRIARGIVREIIVPDLPPDMRLIRAGDLPEGRSVTVGETEIPLLAGASVEHAGQAIALLCGENEPDLHRLYRKFEIQYDRRDPHILTRDFKAEQELNTREIVAGNTAAAFERADHIVEGEYRHEPGSGGSLLPAGALAIPTETGITVVTPTKWLYHVRDAVAGATGIKPEQVQIKGARISGADENCLWYPSLAAAQTAAAAVITGKPVRMIASTRERNQLLRRRGSCIIAHRTALSSAGKVLAMEIKIVAESGAYPIFPAEHLDRVCLAAINGYSSRSLKIEGVQIKTSAPPVDTHGGFGFDGGFFAMEIHATRLAELCGEDPASWRLKNLRPERSLTITRARVGSTPQRKLIDAVRQASDFNRKYAANEMLKNSGGLPSPTPNYLRGIGIASCFHGAGFMSEIKPDSASVSVNLNSQGELSVRSSAAYVPDTLSAVYTNTAAQILNLDSSMIQIEPPDTLLVPDSGPAIFSRERTVVHNLLKACCQAIQKQRFRAPLPLEITRRRAGGRGRRWDPVSFRGAPFSPLSWASCVVEIELDPVSFEITIRGVWIALQAGALENDENARGIVENELMSAFERCTGSEIPPILKNLSIQFLRDSTRSAALRGIAANVFAPALISAVSQATGSYFDALPLSRKVIQEYAER